MIEENYSDTYSNNFQEEKSRTQVKKEAHNVTDFGKKLAQLNENQIKKIPLDEIIINELLKAKKMQKIALKRQLQYIGKLMRNANLTAAYIMYDTLTQKSHIELAKIHRLEQLRDVLVNKDTMKEALDKLITNNLSIDSQKLRQLIRNHHKEISNQNSGKSYRLIFQLLREIMK